MPIESFPKEFVEAVAEDVGRYSAYASEILDSSNLGEAGERIGLVCIKEMTKVIEDVRIGCFMLLYSLMDN